MKKDEQILDIENNFPTPIAATCRRIRVLDEDEIVARHDSLGDMAESIIKFLAIISLQDLRYAGYLPEYFKDFLQNLLHPSLGHWNEILRLCVKEANEKNKIATRIKKFYEDKIEDSARDAAETILIALKSKMKIRYHRDLLNLLILYRNKVWKGHGSKISIEEYRKRLKLINHIILYVLHKIEFLADFNLIYIDEINVLPTGEYKHKIHQGKGSQVEPDSFNYKQTLIPNHVYLVAKEKGKEIYIDLHPLLVSYSCPDCKSFQFYYFNDFRNSRLEFLSYACGHIIYPDMLPNEIEQLLNVSLTKVGPTTPIYENLDEEEQIKQLIKAAKIKISTKEFYEALELLQISESKRSTWEANYYLTLLKIVMGFSLNDMVINMNTCMDLKPDNAETQRLYEFINSEFPDDDTLQEPAREQLEKLKTFALDFLSKEVYTPDVKSVYHIFCPRLFKPYAVYFWVFTPLILLTIRAYISASYSWPVSYPEMILKSSFFIFFIPIVFYISNRVNDIYIILNQQLTDKAKEYFPEWYQEQMDTIFGRFLPEKSFKHRLNLKDSKNKSYLNLAGILIILAISGGLLLTCYGQNDLRYILLQAFDYTLIFGICAPGAPIVVKTYLMLKNYSSFSMKPLLSAMGAISLRKTGRIILVVSIPWTTLGFCFTVLGYLTFTKDIILAQLLLFYFMIFLGITWTIFTPYYFNKSLDKAKHKIIIKYSKYIEDNFNQFLDNPDTKNFERHQWLTKTQNEIKSIKTSIISIGDFISILFINLFIMAMGVMYPFFKWNISFNDAMEWIRSIFLNI